MLHRLVTRHTPSLGAAIMAALLFAAPQAANAQLLTSTVDGTVQDETGAVVPGAPVTITDVDTNVSRETVTNGRGVYVFPQVPAGNYTVEARPPGFSTAIVEDVRIELNTPATIDITVQVGELTETVVVTATESQAVINTINAEINTNISREQVQSLPLNGRNVGQLALTQAGVTSAAGIRDASINGTRGTFNNFTLDGINNQDTFIRTDALFGVVPVKESFIDQISITTSNSDVDAGIGASQTQFVTRRGSNEYHGEVFYYHRNDWLNANTFFNNAAGVPRERSLTHEFGANVGGPILGDRLFFFVNYEEERNPSTASVTRTVLTPSARNGNFSYIRQDNDQAHTVNLYDLTGVAPDPAIQSLIATTPASNDSSIGDGRNTAGYRFNSPNSDEADWIVLRADYEIGDNHSVSGTFHQFRFDLPSSVFNGLDPVFPGLPGGGQYSTRRLASFSGRSTITPTIVNEARVGFQTSAPRFFTNETFADGYRLSLAVFSNPVRSFLPQGRDTANWDLIDNLTWTRGNHVIKLGGSARWTEVDSFNDAGIVPTYVLGFGVGNPDPLTPDLFPGGIASGELGTASALLGVLGGFVDEASQTFNVDSTTSGFVDGATTRRITQQNFLNFYAGDNWRITPDLSLSFGLRWEFHGVPDETQGLALLPVGGVDDILDPNAVVDLAGATNGRPFYDRDLNNFAPNVGLAWQLGDNTVLRAGYGLNYVVDNIITTVRNALSANDGLSQGVTLSGLAGTVSGGLPPIPEPEFKIPRTARDGILADPTAAIFTIDPDLRTPYVQQWNVGFQHMILPDTAFEIRYLGNHGVKLIRAIDLNQVMLPAPFVEDFRRAQRNLAANGHPAAGEPLQIFPQLGFGGLLQSGTVQRWIRNGEIGQYIGGFLAANNRIFFFNGEGGERFGATLPISYFLRQPNAFVADVVGNHAFSKYNALQVELRRRWRSGLTGQFNYTYGKVLTNYSGSQSNFRGLFDNAQPHLEVGRADFDITHTINANWVWELPVGEGRRWMTNRGVLSALAGGWDLSGFVRIRSGEVINIYSGRGTINRGGSRALTNTVHLRGIDIPELQRRSGVFRHEDGEVTLFHPSLYGPSGAANTDIFQNPALLEAGTLGLGAVSGPWYATLDLGLRKNIQLGLTEALRAQLRFDFFNVLNRTNFNVSNYGIDTLGITNLHNINATTFGQIVNTFSARQIQVGMKIEF